MPLIESIVNDQDNSRTLYLFDKQDFENWLHDQPTKDKKWASDNDFTAKGETCLAFADESGGIKCAIIGKTGDNYHDGAVAARLLAGTYQMPATQNKELFALGFALENYRYETKDDKPSKAKLHISDEALKSRVQTIAEAAALTRDLINSPANVMTPAGLEAAARQLADQHKASISVMSGGALEATCPAIHTVGRAAEVPPRLIDICWGDDESLPLITIIGKGVTFDSGGLDLKPSGGMEIMKKDMGGGAHALGLAHAIMGLGVACRLQVLIPAAENAVSDRAMRPLDVIKTAAGIDVEVGNTDAEGRLVLADAIYIALKKTPEIMIDFATLTGAARVALGTELPALFCNDESLSQELITASEKTADPLWRLPLHQPYERFLDAGHMALSSTGASRYGGAITAALFLQRFISKPVAWAHLDVMAWNLSPRYGRPRGGEAMGMRAVLEMIQKRYEA